jgi:hypothetical protein
VQSISSWAVDGIDGGNAQDGTVSGDSDGVAAYQAPSTAPKANPVAVSVELYPPTPLKGKVILVSNVTISACSGLDPTDTTCDYQGTATATDQVQGYSGVSAEATFKVTVTWGPGGAAGTLQPIAGTITATTTEAGCTLSPETATLATNLGTLAVDYSTQPALYGGAGWGGTLFTETCVLSNGSTVSGPWPGGANWFYAPQTPSKSPFTVQPDGSIVGSYQEPGIGSWSWNFQPVSLSSP